MEKQLLLKIFDAAYMQRWNDKLRPIPFIEIDKQAHKMMIAYFLGRFEEKNNFIDWQAVIEGVFFEFLQRMIITDIKPFILDKIKHDTAKYKALNQWIFEHLTKYIKCLGQGFQERYQAYFESTQSTIEKRIIAAAHVFASKWEFDILEKANPNGYDVHYIRDKLKEKIENFYDLEGIKQLAFYHSYQKFIDLCGQLRFQIRWANLHRVPKTSVLGHCFFVAIISYLFSTSLKACPRRIYNNFFTGVFHDLPEVFTRDIISPVKKSIAGLDELIKEYEKEEMQRMVYPLIPDFFHREIRDYTENEFCDYIYLNDQKKLLDSRLLTEKYNADQFNGRDGCLVKTADELAAFIEAYSAVKNGSNAEGFINAFHNIKKKYLGIHEINGLFIGRIFEEFIL